MKRGILRPYVIRCVAACLVFSVTGCGSGPGGAVGTFDNTGGAPPPGTPISFEAISVALDPFCTAQLASALGPLLVRTETDIPVIGGDVACTTSLRTLLAATFAGLTADQAVGIFTLNLGGCVRSYEVAQVMRDGSVIRPWILLHDTTLGASTGMGCTTDVILGIYALRFGGATGANKMELYLAAVNPNYPRDSAVPVW